MAGISQSIPNYYGGISEQPDQLKNPGQVKEALNAIPDLTYGLYKRPGSKRIKELANVQTNGSWFHYYRDETEGSYIGQIASDGTPRVWRCSDGAEMTIAYSSAHSGTQANLKTYLTPSSATNTEDLQFCTINDTTFVNNRTIATRMATGNTASRPHDYGAYLEVLRTENGRQYGINLYDDASSTSTIGRATRLKIKAHNLSEDWGSGQCPGIGVQVFGASETDTTNLASPKDWPESEGKKNLTFRLTILGQTGDRQGDDDGDSDSNSYRCAYSKSIDLLHGGEDWSTGDTTPALGATGVIELDTAKTTYEYQIEVMDHETVSVKGKMNGGAKKGIIRPAPTPWDAQTAVTVDTILGGITQELTDLETKKNANDQDTDFSWEVIGNGIYFSHSSAFNIEICDPDLMRVLTHEINDVSKLPTQCKHGYIVKVSNSQQSEEDDYYLKFKGENNKDGPGSWEECPEPGIVKSLDPAKMPVTIQRTAATTFTVARYGWDSRVVGDETTNPIPTFISRQTSYGHDANEDRYINKVLFFRNRLAFLSGPNIVTSQPGDFGNFWVNTALTVSAIDPIDISMSSTLPSDLYDGLEINAGLLAFSSNSQHLLASDDTIFNPDTAKLRTVSSYNYDKTIPPISLGTTVGFVDTSNKYSRFNEFANVSREGASVVIDQSKVVPSLLPKNVDLICNSRENGLVFFGQTDSSTVIGFKYVTIGDQRLQSAWFKWKLNSPLRYHFIENDKYYFLDTGDFLQSIELVQADSDPSITEDGTNFLIHLDNYTTIYGGVFDPSTNLTTFDHGQNNVTFDWADDVASPAGDLALIDLDSHASHTGYEGRYTLPTIVTLASKFTVPGNWSSEVRTVTITNAGSGYTSAPTVAFTNTGGNTGSGAEGVATISGGQVTGVTITNPGMNYHQGATVAFSGGGGSNAAATATTAPDSTHPLHIGYLYDYQVDFPRIYSTKLVGQNTVADLNASLVLHRVNLSLGKVGLYETILDRVGKLQFSQVHESPSMNLYNASDAPYLTEDIKTIPVYDKNKNVDITLKSTHPSPCTLRSMSWEGDYSPMYYRRG